MDGGQTNIGTEVDFATVTSNTLRDFPDFTPVSSISYIEFSTALANHLPYSSFNYVSIRSYWPDAKAAKLNDGIALQFTDTLTNTPSITALFRSTKSLTENKLEQLINFAKEVGQGRMLRLVPKCALHHIPPGFTAQERPDGHDYLIDITAMLDPTAPGMAEKHQLANGCQDKHPGLVLKELPLHDSDTKTALHKVNSAYLVHKMQPNGTNLTGDWEQQAFLRCLNLDDLPSLNAVIAFTSDGEPIGFTINEILGNGYYMGHFGKTLPGYTGLSELLELETARVMKKAGCRVMNFQEDHNNQGLRKMKQSWNPCGMLRVYDVGSRK